MAVSLATPKTSCHVRSISLPSRSHPLTLRVEEQLYRLRTSEATSSSSPSAICHNLHRLNDLYECVDDLLQLPLTQQALAHEQHEKMGDEMLDGSLRLLDVCGTTRDVLSQMKEYAKDLEASLRRRKCGKLGLVNEVGAYMFSRKKMNKVISKSLRNLKRMENNYSSLLDKDHDGVAMVSLLRQVEGITLSMFESLFSFMSGPKVRSKPSGWSLVSKLKHTKRVACEGEETYVSKVMKVDVALNTLIGRKSCEEIDIGQVQNLQKQLVALEMSIQGLEDGLECLFRHLMKTRVSLLNILNY